jgi:ceramide glucosyltransferase
MSFAIPQLLALVCGLLALCGIGYYCLCLVSARNFLRHWRVRRLPEFAPPVSILKPLRGADPGMYEAFRSHCRQDYPEFEIIFGVAEADDPAVALVRQLQREFPARRIELVLCPQTLGTNLKVSNLVQMLPHARHEYLLVNDSDILVERDYLRRVMAPFADPRVGMVTTLYRGAAGRSLASRLEAVGIGTDFAGGVLASRQLEGVRFALGSTLAFSRPRLEEIGGFAPLLDYLADDFELGNRLAKLGYEVVLSDAVVATHLPDYSFGAFWLHQLRWARSVRDARKLGYLGVVLTFGLPWALAAVALSGGARWSLALLAATVVARLAMALVLGRRVLHDPQLPRDLWLIPLRDVLAWVLWAAAYAGHTIVWRGRTFLLQDGKLLPPASVTADKDTP